MLDALRRKFPGKWDGGPPSREVHGLVDLDGRTLKIEVLLRSSGAVASVFEDGMCASSARSEDAVQAVEKAVEALTAL